MSDRIAVIGCGNRGKVHLGAILGEKRLELAAICDIKPEVMDDAIAKCNIPANVRKFVSYREMLVEIRPDIVVMALWPEYRLPVYMDCIAAGVKYLVSEKPFAGDWGTASEIKKLAESSDCRLSFTHQRRFSPGNRRVRELLADGAIGEIIRLDMYANRHLLDCGTHSIDQAWSYVGENPVSWVLGALDMEEKVRWFDVPGEGAFSGTMMFSNGVYGTIFVGCPGQRRRDPTGVTVFGSKGYLDINWEGHILDYRAAPGKENEVSAAASMTQEQCYSNNTGHMWKHLTDCYESGEIDELNWHHAYDASEVVFALYESVRRRAIVRLPLVGVTDNPLESMMKDGTL